MRGSKDFRRMITDADIGADEVERVRALAKVYALRRDLDNPDKAIAMRAACLILDLVSGRLSPKEWLDDHGC